MDFVDVSDELGQALSRASVLRSLDESFGAGGAFANSSSTAKKQNNVSDSSCNKRNNAHSNRAGGAESREMQSSDAIGTPYDDQADDALMGESATSATTTSAARAGGGKRGADGRVVDCILDLIGTTASSDFRAERFFSQQLKGKALILENVKTQTEAAKFKAKELRNSKRQERVSNTKLKKLGAIKTSSKAKQRVDGSSSGPVALEDLNTMNALWKQYIRTVLKGCKNPLQYQARLMTAELVGAEVIVLDSRGARGQVGMKGIVTSATPNSLVIHPRPVFSFDWQQRQQAEEQPLVKNNASSSSATNTSTTTGTTKSTTTDGTKRQRIDNNNLSKETTPLPFRLIRDDSVLGILLPQQKGAAANKTLNNSKGTSNNTDANTTAQGEPLMCIIHGKRFMPNVSATVA